MFGHYIWFVRNRKHYSFCQGSKFSLEVGSWDDFVSVLEVSLNP